MNWKAWFEKVRSFVVRDAWNPESNDARKHGVLARTVRVGHLLYKGYMDDDLTIHATSLTYGTLTSLVPILAVAIAVMRGFGMGNEMISGMLEKPWYQSLPEGMQTMLAQILKIVTETNFFALGWIGLIIFILTAVFLLSNVERSFNRVWGVEKERNIFRQITNYTCVLVFVPLLIGLVVAVRANLVIQTIRAGGLTVPVGTWGGYIFSFLALWAAIFLLFMFVPNTRVQFSAAAWASLATTVVFVGWMRVFTAMQVGVAKYNYIYGAFAAIPIFMFWLYITWVIWLLGAEFAFALQYSDTYRMERSADSASMRARILLALLAMREAARAMRGGGADFDADAFASKYTVPTRLVHAVIKQLQELSYFAKLDDREKGASFVLKRTPDALPVKDVVAALLRGAPDEMELTGRLLGEGAMGGVMKDLEAGLEKGFGDTTVADLAEAAG